MNLMLKIALGAVGVACINTGAFAQVSVYYLTSGYEGYNWTAGGGVALSEWSQVGTGEHPIAVSGDIRTTGLDTGASLGARYSLTGDYLGTIYPHAGPSSIYDGTTDGAHNYSVTWAGPFIHGTVYRYDRDWTAPTAMFTPSLSAAYLGITYDISDDGLWLSGWGGGNIEHYSKSGTLLSSFDSGLDKVTCLAYDPLDETLWMQEWGDIGHYHQYSRAGAWLGDVHYAMHGGSITMGGEFNIVPEPASLSLLAMGMLAVVVRRSRAGRPRPGWATHLSDRTVRSAPTLLTCLVAAVVCLTYSSPADADWYGGDPTSTTPVVTAAFYYAPTGYTHMAFEDFTWTAGAGGGVIDKVGGNYFGIGAGNVPGSITQAYWEIRSGASVGNAGALVASGVLTPTISSTAFTVSGEAVTCVTADIPDFLLANGNYWFGMSLKDSPTYGWFVGNTQATNGVGGPLADGQTLYRVTDPSNAIVVNYVDLVASYGSDPAYNLDISYFVNEVPEPATISLLAVGVLALRRGRRGERGGWRI